MRPYAVYINQSALDSSPKSGPQHTLVLNFIRWLADNPNFSGDFSEQDDQGRTVFVKVVGRFAVTFWPDHPVAEIKITHIKPADK